MHNMEDDIFKKRSGTTDRGRDYEDVFVANLIVKLVSDDSIKNFKISSNNDDFGVFDDVVLETELRNGLKQNYAFQLKYNKRQLSEKNLIRACGDFAIKKYFNNFMKLEDDYKSYKWVLFTNRRFDDKINKQFRLEGEDFDIKILNYEEENRILGKGLAYKLETSDENYQTFFNKFILCTNQANVEQLREQTCKKLQEAFSCDDYIVDRFFKFVTNWSIKEGEKEKLDKSMMKQTLALLLSSPFLCPISTKNTKSFNLLRIAISKFTVSVFEEEKSETVSKIWGNISNELESFDIKEINKIGLRYQVFPKYIHTVNLLTEEESSKLLWLLNVCPLIVKDNPSMLKIIDLCSDKNFVVLNTKMSCEIKFSSIFRNLYHLKSEEKIYEDFLKNLKCSIQGKEEITLEDLIGECEEIERTITTNELLQMEDNSFQIGGEVEDYLPKFYIDRSLSRHIIDDNFLEDIPNNTAVIVNGLANTKRLNVIDVEDISNEEILFKNDENNIFTCKEELPPKIFAMTCEKIPDKSKYHQLRVVEDDKLEWIRSIQGIEDLEQFRDSNHFVTEPKIYCEENNIEIICADPGMGKSTLMRHIKTKISPPTFWTFLIYPKDHSRYFREEETDAYNFTKYLVKEASKNSGTFFSKLLILLRTKNRLNFIWDGLDEISEKNLEIVINLIEELSKKGFKQWITSRNNLKTLLEKKFNVLSRNIRPFDEEDQKNYIRRRLDSSEDSIQNVFKKIKNQMQLFKDNDILGIPLQIYMFTELFTQNPIKYDSLLNEIFSLTDLYSHFVDEKFNIYHRFKEDIAYTNDILFEKNQKFKRDRIELYGKAAIRAYFLQNLNCEDFLNEIRRFNDPVGLITAVSEDNIANFWHNSYGEYFAALYLSQNPKMVAKLSDLFFDERHKNIRFMFDSIMAKNCPIHVAVLYKNLEMVHNCDNLNLKDSSGRNPLQLASSWGERYPLLKVKKLGKFSKIYKNQSSQPKKENSEFRKIVEFLSERCNPKEKDQLFRMNSFEYADKALCLLPLDILSKNHKINFDKLKNFKNIPSVLYYCVVFDYPNIFDVIKNIPLIYDNDGYSLLYLSVLNSSMNTFKKIISKRSYKTMFKNDVIKNSLLSIPCDKKDYATLQTLIDYGADINAPINKFGDMVLHKACRKGYLEMVNLLITHKADINARDSYNETPLHMACRMGHHEIVEVLTRHGADVNAANEFGDRPLHKASINENFEIVQVLVAHGADINAENKYHENALQRACENGQAKIVEVLLEHGVDVNSPNQMANTPLHRVCKNGHDLVVRLLIEKGANVNAVNQIGSTPLHEACRAGFAEICTLLVEHGADVDALNKCGKKPFDYLATSYPFGM